MGQVSLQDEEEAAGEHAQGEDHGKTQQEGSQLSTSQGQGSHQKPIPPTTLNSIIVELREISFCSLSPLVWGTLF